MGENCLFIVELNVEYDWHVTDTPNSTSTHEFFPPKIFINTFFFSKGMMDIHSTQALPNLARSGNFLPPTSAPSGGGTSAFSPPASLEATAAAVSKKRPPTSEALDLSPPNNTGSSSSISNNKKAKLELAGNLKSNITATTSGSPSTVLDPTVVLNWKVSDVCQFVSSIDICREYTEVSF